MNKKAKAQDNSQIQNQNIDIYKTKEIVEEAKVEEKDISQPCTIEMKK